jgi:zinc protease
LIRPTVLLGISLALSGAIGLLGETSQEVPSHPRQLQFEQEQQRLPTVEGRRHELKSGAVVYVVEDHTLPLVEIGLATRAGSYLDPPKKTGLAALTATQLRRGGSRELGPDEFDDRVDDLGALLDSQAGGSRAGARLSVPSWSFSDSLDLFFDMISKPAFNSARLENARTSYLESLTRRNENPLDIMQREWGWLL